VHGFFYSFCFWRENSPETLDDIFLVKVSRRRINHDSWLAISQLFENQSKDFSGETPIHIWLASLMVME
jgi:hypothetical protein